MPGPFYRPRYGADLELACLDTSRDTQEEIHRYLQAPKHQQWLRSTFGRRGDRWLIPYSHHLVYSAGPNHQNDHTQLLGGGCVRGGAPRLGVVVLPKICRLGLPASDKLRLGPRHLANFARYLFLGPVQGGGTPVGWRLRSGPAGVSLSPVSEAVVRRSHW